MLGNFSFAATTPITPSTATLGTIGPDSTLPASQQGNLSEYESLDITVTIASNGSGGALDIYVQKSPDSGTTWIDCIHLPSRANAAAAVVYDQTLTRQSTETTPVVTGTEVLAANTVVHGEFGDRLRFRAVAGSGTTTTGVAVTVKVMGRVRQ